MKLKALYDHTDEIPKMYRDLFTEREGVYELTGIEGLRTQSDVDRLQGSLRKERADHKTTRDKLSANDSGSLGGSVDSQAQAGGSETSNDDQGAMNALQLQLSESQSTISMFRRSSVSISDKLA